MLTKKVTASEKTKKLEKLSSVCVCVCVVCVGVGACVRELVLVCAIACVLSVCAFVCLASMCASVHQYVPSMSC